MCLPTELRAQQAGSDEGAAAAEPQNVPPAVQRAEAEIERTARRFRLGIQGGAGIDPEILDFGVHAQIGPIFSRNVTFRPVFEIGAGEVTTMLGINLDVIYALPGFDGDSRTEERRWVPYVGAGPTFGLSHQGFETDDVDNVNAPGVVVVDDDRNRFDFSDTDFNGGLNFIVGMRRPSGAFFEMKTTAWGVSNIRLLAGFNFF
jgi:hypothetical protein